MKIEFDEITLKINHEEAIDLYYAIKGRITKSIEKHWVSFPETFEQGERTNLHIMKQLLRIIDHEPYDYVLNEFKNMLTQK